MPPRSDTKQQQGMTLLEILLANAILAVIIVIVFQFMGSMTDNIDLEFQRLTLEQDANRVLEEMAHTLRSCRVTPKITDAEADALASYQPHPVLVQYNLGSDDYPNQAGQICFQVPVDHDEDGDMMVAEGQTFKTEWGAKREDLWPRDYLDAHMIYRFVPETEFREAERNFDLNQDGDRTDVFDIGRMELVFTQGGSHKGLPPPRENGVFVNMMSGNSIVRVKGQPVGDIDSDGKDDPMFSLTRLDVLTGQSGTGVVSSVLTITIFTTRPAEKIPLLVRSTTSIELRNDRPGQ